MTTGHEGFILWLQCNTTGSKRAFMQKWQQEQTATFGRRAVPRDYLCLFAAVILPNWVQAHWP